MRLVITLLGFFWFFFWTLHLHAALTWYLFAWYNAVPAGLVIPKCNLTGQCVLIKMKQETVNVLFTHAHKNDQDGKQTKTFTSFYSAILLQTGALRFIE